MITLYNVISRDGFIADKDGNEDFIPDELWNDFLELCTHYDVVVMGRKTYEAIQGYDDGLIEAFEKLAIKKIVVSTREDFRPKAGYIKISQPREIINYGSNILLTSGPSLNTFFLTANLLDKVIFNELPVEIGEGIKPFSVESALKLEKEEVLEGRIKKYFHL